MRRRIDVCVCKFVVCVRVLAVMTIIRYVYACVRAAGDISVCIKFQFFFKGSLISMCISIFIIIV